MVDCSPDIPLEKDLDLFSLDSSFNAEYEDAAKIPLSAAVQAHLATPLPDIGFVGLTDEDLNTFFRFYQALKNGVQGEQVTRLYNNESP